MSFRLLIPTVRSPIPVPQSPWSSSPTTRSPRLKPTPAKLVRSQSGSASLQSSPDPAPVPAPPPSIASTWLGKPYKFDIVVDTLQLEGYQMYAVEKWVVERTRAIIVLAVYTGDPQHKITVTALSPSPSLPPQEARVEWNNALHHLRRDGARPKQTPHGVLMVTSLAHFRSDYTIVQIPNGDFLATKERLYTNINLSRMGCSGRSALTLEEPSETTKDRFRSTYLLPDTPTSTPFRARSHSRAISISAPPVVPASSPSTSTSPSIPSTSPFTPAPSSVTSSLQNTPSSIPQTRLRPFFNATVLELVKLIQAALAICGTFPLAGIVNAPTGQTGTSVPIICEPDGLLCDVTVEGLQRWVSEIGEPCVGVEPMERVADPTTICALLSLVLASRNKLANVSSSPPKDPFLHPHTFINALSIWAQSHVNGIIGSTIGSNAPLFSPTHSPRASLSVSVSRAMQNSPTPSATGSTTTTSSSTYIYLTQETYSALKAAHEHKMKHAGRRAVLGGLSGFATGLRNDSSEESAGEAAAESDPVVAGVSKRGTKINGGSGGGGGKGIGGRGGQLLMSGIENLASGFVGRVASSGPATVTVPSSDLGAFIKVIVGRGERDKGHKEKDKDGERNRGGDKRGADGEPSGVGSVSGVAGSLRALFSGRVEGLVRLRTKIEGRHNEAAKHHDTIKNHDKDRAWKHTQSDPEDAGLLTIGERTDGGKSGSTGTEDDLAFAGAWSGRVQKKLEMWTGLNRPRKSVELASTTNYIPSLPKGRSLAGIAMSTESSSSGLYLPSVAGGSSAFPIAKHPSHPAVVVSGDTGEEEELLSSGQVSPISETRTHNPFSLGLESPGASSLALDRFGGAEQPDKDGQAYGLSEHGKRVHSFLMRRPGLGRIGRERESRVSSWSDTISAREGERGKVSDSFSQDIVRAIVEGPEDEGNLDAEAKKRVWKRSIRRRHSFHDAASFRSISVLKPQWMRIDVELCGQLLVMHRRDTHLRSVLSCFEHITNTLSTTNASLRNEYQEHHALLTALESQTALVSQIETTRNSADGMAQQAQALRYESRQLHVDDLWHSAAPSREKVLALREKVFGMDAGLGPGNMRYVKAGKGRFNRVQWTLDGQERMVDAWGRTESEAEEETKAGFGMYGGADDEEGSIEEDREVVEHTAMKPVWLLRFFTSWGARWGSSAWKGAGVQPASDEVVASSSNSPDLDT